MAKTGVNTYIRYIHVYAHHRLPIYLAFWGNCSRRFNRRVIVLIQHFQITNSTSDELSDAVRPETELLLFAGQVLQIITLLLFTNWHDAKKFFLCNSAKYDFEMAE